MFNIVMFNSIGLYFTKRFHIIVSKKWDSLDQVLFLLTRFGLENSPVAASLVKRKISKQLSVIAVDRDLHAGCADVVVESLHVFCCTGGNQFFIKDLVQNVHADELFRRNSVVFIRILLS